MTSGADPSAWDPIQIDEEEDEEEEGVVDSDMGSDEQNEGVTSGNDTVTDGDVKSSERKNKKDPPPQE